MQALEISAIVGLIVALILAIVVWTIVIIECRRVRRQRKINGLIDRIRERAEDSGNESEGDTEELAKLVEMGDYDLGDAYNL
uniref:Protein Vpu n=12 Tax=Human immunodeficiency virus type 1 TaxID=11676 RepID=I6YZY9_HV1|nr:vpu protein [Human immunodeficiency virus 1]AGC33416.1 vpu protein [Human immunodeficiency virus 1]AGC33424.1 vpu protein [Human immunodeficiency virus 1]AGC33432.1 vpu protein [Human immunodeficiency virus 1]AGC33440.1 vpu protein [Human immunodeficiency virus 1]